MLQPFSSKCVMMKESILSINVTHNVLDVEVEGGLDRMAITPFVPKVER